MDKIYCLVGRSGSGKTTIAKTLEKDYNVIHSYTTRPPREPGEWGHIFVDRYPPEHVPGTIAYNYFDGYEYWAINEQVKGTTIYIIDPPGDAMLRNQVDCPVTTICLTAGNEQLYERLAKSRGQLEAKKRMLHDYDIFAIVKTDYVVDTDRPFNDVLNSVRDILEGNI
jgi:guanylate kinase